jgi:hypothetical protein
MSLLSLVRPGDRVTIRTPQGQDRSGRCVMKFPTHATLNMGGSHGTPGVATDANIVRVNRNGCDGASVLRPWMARRG